jgi:hypothetical protein
MQNQRPITEMPRSKATFGAVLAGQHPVHRRIQVILVTRSHPEQLLGELVAVSVRSLLTDREKLHARLDRPFEVAELTAGLSNETFLVAHP